MAIIPDLKNNLPHVVILGAGASLAAFPKGDKNGTRLPLMNSIVEDLGLTKILQENHIEPIGNFELLYEAISNDPSKKNCRSF